MATVLLAGAYGQRNPGDEALLSSFLRALPQHRIIATSADPEGTVAAHGCEAVSSFDRSAIFRALFVADSVVMGGGTIFKQLHPSTGRSPHELLRNASLLSLAARATAKPVLLVGVSAAMLPDARARRLARHLVRRAALLVLRDDHSARILAEAGAPTPFRVGADPTWAMLAEAPTGVVPVEDVVVVTVSRYAAARDRAGALADGLRRLRAEGLRICLQPWQVDESLPDDLTLTHTVARAVGGPVELLDPPADLHDAVRQAASARLVVGMRFHSLVAAAAAGTRAVAFDHEPKLGALAQRFGQLTLDPYDDVEWADRMVDALARPGPDPAVVAEQVALADEGFRLLRLVLGGGGEPEARELIGLPLEPPVEQTA
jgi:polysaccharide pyruvyl transferase CsaB